MPSALLKDHQMLRELMDQFVHIMRPGGSRDSRELAKLRVDFSRTFNRHVLEESARVRALATSTCDEASREAILEYPLSLQALARDYSAHVNKWTREAIAEDQVAYYEAVLRLQVRLKTQMNWEEEHIFPLFN